MRRTVLSIAAVLLTAACSSTTTVHSSPAIAPAPSATSSHSAAARASSTPSSAKTKASAASPQRACSAPPERDVIVRYIVPGLPDSAQVLGNWNYGLCEGTFQSLQSTSPTGAGYCTEAAWASDNPGYNADATSAAPLKKVQMSVGPAC